MFPKLSCNTAIAAVSIPLARLSRFRILIYALILGPLLFLFCDVHLARPAQVGEADVTSSEFFRQKISPILSTRCLACHSDAMKSSGLSLESAEGLKKGGEHGPVVVPRSPSTSRLYRRVAHLEEPYMPMGLDPLPAAEVELLKQWIEKGAYWPATVNGEATKVPEAAPIGASGKTVESAAKPPLSPADIFFRTKVFPIFSNRCVGCHNDARRYAGLSLESADDLFDGGSHGPEVVPGNPGASRLYRRVARLERPYMPLGKTSALGDSLPESEIAVLKLWIEQGAHWPRDEEAVRQQAAKIAPLKKLEERSITEKEREWWSFQKPVRPPVPHVKNSGLVRNPVDAFVLAKLESKGLQPAPLASRRTLVRRVYFDLIGLPPRPEDVDLFLNDKSPKAYENLIDRLLASKHYGERWGRHWLDVARFADGDGYEYDKVRPQAWRYRDYVIRSFNEDKPYDRFIREQLAGDELPDRNFDSLIATQFCRNGPFIGDMVLMQDHAARMNELDDMVVGTTAAFMGLTVGCARCHNHKYDPIGQRDYYRLIAVFSPSIRVDIPLAPKGVAAKYESEIKDVEDRIEVIQNQIRDLENPLHQRLLEVKYGALPEPLQVALKTDPAKRTEAQRRQAEQLLESVTVTDAELTAAMSEGDRKKVEVLEGKIADLEKTKPPPLAVAHAIIDPTAYPSKSYFLYRGNPASRGSVMLPGTLAVLNAPGVDVPFPPPDPTANTTLRRLTLANWIASDHNPLTSRVMVNRIWQHHFGKALVGTPNDFGKMGEKPDLPELLDWLATEFVQQGWSIKTMQRLIMTSRTYQESSTFLSPSNAKIDPENRYFWKMPLHRLEGDAIRDSILVVSGGLNPQAGGPGVFPEIDPAQADSIPKGALYQSWPPSKDGPEVWRRSVYVIQRRSVTPPILDLFDPPDSITSCPRRNATTVAPQALQLLNNKFVSRQATVFADRVIDEVGADQTAEVQEAFALALSRPPRPAELKLTLDFLKRQMDFHRNQNRSLLEQGVDPAQILAPGRAALVDVCHSLFNINEFVYVN